MSDSTLTGRLKAKPPSPSEDEIVELRPPDGSGFGGTVKLYQTQHADEIRILKLRGYSVVKDAA